MADLSELGTLVADRRSIPLPKPTVARALRVAAGLSVYDFGRLLGVGAPTISRWETGRRRPRGDLRRDYARLLEELRHV